MQVARMPGEPSTTSTLGWKTEFSLDLSTLDAADWTTGSGHKLAGYDVTTTNPGVASELGLDGATGLELGIAGNYSFSATARLSPSASVQLSDLFSNIANTDHLAVCVDFLSATGHAHATDAFGVLVEADPSDTSAWAARLRSMGAGNMDAQAMEGGSAAIFTVTPGAAVRRMIIEINGRLGYIAAYFTTTAGASAPTWADLSSWTRHDDGALARVRVDNAAEFDLLTDWLTLFVASGSGGGCGVVATGLHGARFGLT